MTIANELGRLEKVELRDVWASESSDFTPWLAQETNIELLADTLGLDMEVEAQEMGVGPYRADIVCKDVSDGSLVLIENQLEKTDHSHLGQLLTYAAGLDAVTIVWIAERFTDEHRAAMDWLNENTGESVSFFGLEIQLWRIGESPIAPKFNVVSKPNDWIKGGSGGAKNTSLENISPTKLLQRDYWIAFREVLAARSSNLKVHKANPQHWLTVSIGRANFNMSATVNTNQNRIAVEVYMNGPLAKQHFHRLKEQQVEIETEIGIGLDWRELPEKDTSRILIVRNNSSIKESECWAQQHQWLADTLEKFNKVFRPRISQLPVSYESEVEEA